MITTPYSGIITKGLGMPAMAGFITYHFSLFVLPYEPPRPPPRIGGGGGHVPFGLGRSRGVEVGSNRPRSVQTRNVPLNIPAYYTKQNKIPANVVVLTVKIAGKEIKREYITTKNRADIVIKVIGVFTKARAVIKVVAEGLFGWINKKDRGDQ